MVNHKTLSLLCNTFIRPQLEYASEVWGGCSNQDSERLEKLLLAAARIVKGLTKLASWDSLYYKTGLETFADGRNEKLRTLVYKIYHNMVPSYLTDIFSNNRLLDSNYVTNLIIITFLSVDWVLKNHLSYQQPLLQLHGTQHP